LERFLYGNLSVVLPEGLGKDEKLSGAGSNPATGSNPKSLEIGVKDCLFDKMGFTGEVFMQNVLALKDGTLGGWAFSMDTISINIEANSLKGGRLAGLVNVPLFKNSDSKEIEEKDCVRYFGRILPGNTYEFIVTPPLEKMKAKVWKAEIKLTTGTAISIKYVDKKFKAEAIICGDISIASSPDSKIEMPKIHFEGMTLSNKKPYMISPGAWEFPSTVAANFGGFELEFKNIAPVDDPDTNLVGIGIDPSIKLAPGDGIDISASGRLQILGKVEDGLHQKWVYEKIKVKQVHVNASFKENHIKGGLVFYDNDPGALKWGKGFRGYLDAKFGALKVDVKAIAQFGKTKQASTNGSEYRYFMVDAMINLGKGIPLAPGFDVKGFGGGITYHMKRIGFAGALDSNITQIDTTVFAGLGESLSKVIYSPTDSFGLGLKATVAIAATAEKAFSANVSLEVLMNSTTVGGGIAKIVLSGNARFMSDFKIKAAPAANKTPDPSTKSYNGAPISAYAEIEFDFNTRVFFATLEVAVNASDGTLTGGGQAALYVSDKEWYINIGTPSKRIYLETKVNGVKQKTAEGAEVSGKLILTAYLDLGTAIPDMPSLPDKVSSLTGLGNLMTSESKRKSGSGFAFGASIAFDMESKVWKIYTKMNFELGFDVMVRDYGKTTLCSNNDNKPIGINGWYASGQMYAYIGGEVGIHHKGKDYPVGSLAVAAALQAKLPNPFYARGAIAVKYSILAGLIKGNTKVAFEVGEQCKINIPNGASSAAPLIPIIGDIDPGDNTKDVSVMTQPKIEFNVPMDSIFTDEALDGTKDTYRAWIKSYSIYSTKNKNSISCFEDWNHKSQYMILSPSEALPSRDSIKVRVEVQIQKNGVYLPDIEIKEVFFTTGDEPTRIDDENVKVSYPLKGQYNYYKKQITTGKGYIELKYGQADLFDKNINGVKVNYFVRYRAKSDNKFFYTPFTYNTGDKRFYYDLLANNVKNGQVHQLQVIAIGENEKPNGILDQKFTYEQELYTMYFRASEYDTFGDKIKALNDATANNTLNKKLTAKNVENFQYLTRFEMGNNFEPFDKYELYGGRNFPALIEITTKLEDNPIYKATTGRAVGGSKFKESDYYSKFVDLSQYQNGTYLEVNENSFTSTKAVAIPQQYFEYGLNEIFQKDFVAIKNRLSKAYPAILYEKDGSICYGKIGTNLTKCINDNPIEKVYNPDKPDDLLFSEFEVEIYKNEVKLDNLSGTYKFILNYNCSRLVSYGDSEQTVEAKK
jgi:hypothetical protein